MEDQILSQERHMPKSTPSYLKKKPRTWKDEAISFSLEDLEGVHTLHDDAIVIIATIYNHVLKRVLFNNGMQVMFCTMTP